MNTGLALAIVLLLLSPAQAGVITLQARAQAFFHKHTVDLALTITNQGDEPAESVQISAEVLGKIQNTPVRSSVAPNEPFESTLHFSVSELRPGEYPVFVRITYTDTNAYPFSALALTGFRVGPAERSRVRGALGQVRIRDTGAMTLRLHEMEKSSKKIDVRLFVPQELSADPATLALDLPAGGETDQSMTLKNLTAKAGSVYPIYAVLQYDQSDKHFTTFIPGLVRISDSRAGLSVRNPWVLLFVLVLVLLIALNWPTTTRKKIDSSKTQARRKNARPS